MHQHILLILRRRSVFVAFRKHHLHFFPRDVTLLEEEKLTADALLNGIHSNESVDFISPPKRSPPYARLSTE